MSRSNNTEIQNPAARWFEWGGSEGIVKYYDKEAKKDVNVPLPFTFIVLDTLSAVKGWHDASESGIYSNEVKDVSKDALIVKSFKGPQIAEGFYRDIKDKVSANGGHFVSSIYIAFKDGDVFWIGNIQFKGAALNSWVEFSKKNRANIMKQAVVVTGFEEGKKGSVVFKTPVFGLKDIKEDTDQIAKDLDVELQAYLDQYFKRKKVTEQADTSKGLLTDEEVADLNARNFENMVAENEIGGSSNLDTSDDLPF